MAYINETLDADGDTAEVQWKGGLAFLDLNGDFGGGTATVQVKPNNIIGDAFVDVVDGSFTANSNKQIRLPKGLVKINLNGATSPDLDIYFSDMVNG